MEFLKSLLVSAMKIAILCTSNDTSDFARRHETDDLKYVNIIKPLRPDWQLHCFAVWLDEFPDDISAYDGIIITGSPASVHDGHDWIAKLADLVRKAYRDKIALFGGCFGHQIIAQALGGKVEGNMQGGWSIGKETTIFDAEAPFGLAGQQLSIYSIHKEEVSQLPTGAVAIGSNAYCRYPAFIIGDRVLCSQYHPEMTEVFLVDLINELRGVVPDKQLAQARQQFQSGHQGEQLIRAVINFFEAAKGA